MTNPSADFGVHSEVGKVADRVGAAAGDDLAIAVLQNQHGRFARDARYLAEHKLVGDQIGEDGYGQLGKRFDDLPQAVVFFNMLCHQYAGSQMLVLRVQLKIFSRAGH